MDADQLQIIILFLAQLLLFLSALKPILPIGRIPLNQHLLPGFRGSGFNGRDVFFVIAR